MNNVFLNYEWIIDYDDVTLEDCINFYAHNKFFVIEDGHIKIILVGENND